RAEQRKDLRTVALVSQRQEQHRRGVGVRGGDAGESVLGPGTVLHAESGERLAVLHPRIAVGDAHAYPLLAAEHGPDVGLGRGLDQRRRRIGAQDLGALNLENAGDGIDDFHGRRSLGLRDCRPVTTRAGRPNVEAETAPQALELIQDPQGGSTLSKWWRRWASNPRP